jgi:hypothetical protein
MPSLQFVGQAAKIGSDRRGVGATDQFENGFRYPARLFDLAGGRESECIASRIAGSCPVGFRRDAGDLRSENFDSFAWPPEVM